MLCSVVVLMTPLPVRSQDTVAANVPARRPRVGVALGGGGAKGAAHIGVLKYLEEMHIPVDYVVGTSMGSIIGGLYSMGYSADELADLIGSLDWSLYMRNSVDRRNVYNSKKRQSSTFVLSVPFGFGGINRKLEQLGNVGSQRRSLLSTLPSSFVGGNHLVNLFNNLSLGYQDSISFDSLPIPFACVATDLLTGDSAIIRHGSFATAIRSSMAIPGVFSPVSRDGRLLVDGGLVNNFPVDVCRDMGADIVIGIEVAQELDKTEAELQSLPQLLMQLMNVVIKGDRLKNQQMCDLYIHPDVSGYNMLSFSHEAIDTLVARGYADASRFHDQFQAIHDRVNPLDTVRQHFNGPAANNLVFDSVCLAGVVLNGLPESEARWLQDRIAVPLNRPVSGSDIEDVVGKIYGTGCYSDVTYFLRPVSTEGNANCTFPNAESYDWYEIIFDIVHSEPHNFSVGFRYDLEESAAIAFGINLNQNKLSGFRSDFYIRLSYNPQVSLDLSCGIRNFGTIHLGAQAVERSLNVFDPVVSSALVSFNKYNVWISFSEFHSRFFSISVKGDYMFDHVFQLLGDKAQSYAGYFENYDYSSLGLALRCEYDNRDDSYFPTLGSELSVDVDWRMPAPLGSHVISDSYGDLLLMASTNIATPRKKFIVTPQLYSRLLVGENPFPLYYNVVGGDIAGRFVPHQLPYIGVKSPIVVGDAAAILRCDFRWNFYGKHNIIAIVNAIRSTDKVYGFLSKNSDDFNDCAFALRYAYQSLIGPIMFDVQYSLHFQKYFVYGSVGFKL